MSESKFKKHFPIFDNKKINGFPLCYLDSAATTQKPKVVIDTVKDFYEQQNSSINRSAHTLGYEASMRYEDARKYIAQFIGAKSEQSIVFTKGTTESINLAAYGLRDFFKEGDEIVLTEMEHHANIVPWYLLAQEKGLVLKVAPITDTGEIDLVKYEQCFTAKTKLACMVHASNALGTINNIKEMIAIAKKYDALTLIDGTQALAHIKIDVTDLNTDFYAISSHKAYGPTGVGALYGKKNLFEKMKVFLSGGDMISHVSFDEITFKDPPSKFEAGTPNIEGAIGFHAALQFLQSNNFDEVIAYENFLATQVLESLKCLDNVKIIGEAKDRVSLVSFTIGNVHPHDIVSIFDSIGIAVRAGHLCAQPLATRLKVPAFLRASFAMYNEIADIERLLIGIHKVKKVFGV